MGINKSRHQRVEAEESREEKNVMLFMVSKTLAKQHSSGKLHNPRANIIQNTTKKF
jgi:hypothetical protein